MPIPKTTKFTAFEFTPEEFYGATRFTQLNLMLIQTLAADVINDRADLIIDLKSGKSWQEAQIEFLQREAALKGQGEAYEHLLLLANETQLPTTEPQGA